jgi:pyrimidine-nucleoside phosphorylase
MRMTDIIHKKKHKQELTEDEINFFINGYVNSSIPDYQVSSLLMAIWFNGMSENETVALTKAMVNSGDTIDLSFIDGIKVDKHSTGGVGDKISLIVTPIVASLGIPVAKMSGRGLGHTGGTIDKLESIEGFNTSLSIEQFKENVKKHKICIIGQTGNLVPADKKLYALRDVTETVDSIPLIASSIMSKKIASGADAIVLDVKVGSGAFMKDVEHAEVLARTMVDIGERLNRKTVAILSNMNQPLGNSIGNKIELQEVVKLLRDKEGEDDLIKLSIEIASYMYYLSGIVDNSNDAIHAVTKAIHDKSAYEKFVEFVEAQGGDIDSIHTLNAKYEIDIISEFDGYVKEINSEEVGIAAMILGAGRATKTDSIDFEVGLKLHGKIGKKVKKGDKLFTIYSNKEDVKEVKERLLNSINIVDEKVEVPETVYKVIW